MFIEAVLHLFAVVSSTSQRTKMTSISLFESFATTNVKSLVDSASDFVDTGLFTVIVIESSHTG
jgi:hypothetical protein